MIVKNKHQLIQTIAHETYHMCRFLESCKYSNQLETTRIFCDKLIDRWNDYAEPLKQKDVDDLTPFVKCAVDNISASYTNTKSIIDETNSPPEKIRPEDVVVKGFC